MHRLLQQPYRPLRNRPEFPLSWIPREAFSSSVNGTGLDPWSNEACNTSGITDNIPCIVIHNHVEKHIARKHLSSEPVLSTRACLKNHSRNLHAPLCGIFHPNSVAVARYGALIRAKSPTNCDAHLAESLFQTRSTAIGGIRIYTVKIISLEMTDHSQSLIIHYDHLHRDILTLHPLQLLDIHLECSVSADTCHRLSCSIISSDSCRKCISHSTMSAGKKCLLALLIVEGLIAPYHMLSHIHSNAPVSESLSLKYAIMRFG